MVCIRTRPFLWIPATSPPYYTDAGRSSYQVSSNKSFEELGEIVGADVMAAALIDRLLRRCQIVNIRGNSYRMRQHTELWQALQTPASEENHSTPKRPRNRKKAVTP